MALLDAILIRIIAGHSIVTSALAGRVHARGSMCNTKSESKCGISSYSDNSTIMYWIIAAL